MAWNVSRGLILGGIVLGACSVNLDVPDDANITCASDRDCPDAMICDAASGRCVSTSEVAPEAPSVVIERVGAVGGRSLVEAPITLRLLDVNGPPRGNDVIDIAAEYSLDGGGTWHDAHAAGATQDLVPNGEAFVFRWDLVGDAAPGGLGVVQPDLDGDPSTSDGMSAVDFHAAARLRFLPTDSRGLAGALVTSEPFDVGNVPPALTIETLDLAYSRQVNLAFQLVDAASDVARIEAEFRVGSATTWESEWTRAATLGAFLTDDLSTSPVGQPHVFIWDSTAPPEASVSTPQGAGKTSWARVEFRMRAIDAPGPEGEEHFGPWTYAPSTFELQNQTPPRLEDIVVPKAGRRRATGPVAIHYRAVDVESDPVDVRFEASLDGGATWRTCVEYRSPSSEGTRNLATRSPLLGGVSGVAHTFVWDTSGLSLDTTDTPLLRGFIADDQGTTSSGIFGLAHPVGPAVARPITDSSWHCGERIAADCDTLCTWTGTACIPARLDADAAPLGAAPIATALADFDRDGFADIAVANNDAARGIAVAFGDGAGGFANVAEHNVGAAVRAMALADFDGDGDLDIAAMHASGTALLLGSPSGVFSNGTPSSFTGVTTLVAADFNEDDVPDLAAPSGMSFAYAIANGSGGFGSTAFELLPSTAKTLAVGDFDGDTHLDVVASAVLDFTTFLGRGDGSFDNRGFTPHDAVTFAQALDFDADGDDDLVVTADTVATLEVLSFDAAVGAWTVVFDAGTPSANSLPRPAQPVSLGDFNGDEIIDLAVAGIGVSLWLGGGGSFGEELHFDVGPWDAITAGDLNGDGADEALVAFNGANLAVLMRHDWRTPVSGVLGDPLAIDVHDGSRTIVTADFNADGIADLATADDGNSPSSADVSVLIGAGQSGFGDGSFADPVAYDRGWTTQSLVAGDFDADGITDLVSVEELGLVAVWLGNGAHGAGDGRFTLGQTQSTSGMYDVTAADIDGDGDRDIVAASATAALVLRNRGDATFEAPVPYSGGTGNNTVVCADVNEDGIVDLIVAGSSGARLRLGNGAAGVGDGTFGTSNPISVLPSDLKDVLVTDLNGDDILDLVAAVEPAALSGDELAVALGNGTNGRGNGTFGTRQVITTALEPTSLASADFDADGRRDLAVVSARDDLLSILLGDGAGDFADPFDISIGDVPFGVVAADFNRDALPDVAAVHGITNDVWITLGQVDVQPAWVEAAELVGPSPASGVDRFGRALLGPQVTLRRTGIVAQRYANLPDALRAEVTALPTSLVPLSAAITAYGDVHLQRVLEADIPGVEPTGPRWRVTDRMGMDLVAGRGVVIDLPISPAQCLDTNTNDLCDAVESAAAVHVYRRSIDWMRASELPCTSPPPGVDDACTGEPELCDPLAGHPSAQGFLPRRPRCVDQHIRYEDVYVERAVWTPVTLDGDATFATGGGARYFIVHEKRPRVRVLTDRLGDFQAFVEMP